MCIHVFLLIKIIHLSAGMKTRLWKYISTFSNLSGEGLYQIYSKLKQEQDAVGPEPSQVNGSSRGYRYETSNQISGVVQRGIDTGKFEAWKRMKRAEAADINSVVQPLHERSSRNATRISDPNSTGILGSGPSDNRYSGNEKSYKMRPTGQPSRQGFPSGVN